MYSAFDSPFAHLRMAARQHFFGAGPGIFGPGWGGEDRRRGRMFEKGDLKYVVLDLLQDKPRHGYEIIRELEERFSGFYSPSPGAVYPTLQLLEDLGHVSSDQRDGKKVYTITDQGRAFLASRREEIDAIRGRLHGIFGDDRRERHAAFHEMRNEMNEFRKLFMAYHRQAWEHPEKIARLRDVLARARQEIETILKDQGPVTQ